LHRNPEFMHKPINSNHETLKVHNVHAGLFSVLTVVLLLQKLDPFFRQLDNVTTEQPDNPHTS
jgi:hypothetical protein